MPSTRRHSYDLNFKLKIVAEAEAVNNNREIACEYGISQENAGFCTQEGLDQRCLSFVYSFTDIYLHSHFSLALFIWEIWKSYILLRENTRL